MNKKIGIFIPGRLASERLPNKLILPLGDSNLWEIACRKLSNLPDKYNTYALCYDDELIEIATKYGIDVVVRDEETTNVDGPLDHIFKDIIVNSNDDTHLMFLNPCVYGLTVETIIEKLEEFENSDKDYATSVKPLQNWLFDGNGESMNYINYKRLSTKEVNPIYQAAHCFHIFNKKNFYNDGMMLKEDMDTLEIPVEETLDVDTQLDYEFAKFKLAKIYVFDIDDTICVMNYCDLDYSKAKPLMDRIEKINNLYDAGNTIKLLTARGTVTGIDWREVTEKQLGDWGLKYHELHFGKPDGDVYVDDKGVKDNDFF